MKHRQNGAPRIRQAGVCLLALLLAAAPAGAETAVRIDPVEGGHFVRFTSPYRARRVPDVNLANTSRLESLIRAGNLYLSAQDVVALSLENNIDIEVQRYGPLMAREDIRRAQIGGALRAPTTAIAAGPQSVTLAGINVSSTSLASGAGVSSSGNI